MTERIQTNMERSLRRQDAIAKALRGIAEQEATSGKSVPKIVREYAEVGITLDKYDPNKSGYPADRNMI